MGKKIHRVFCPILKEAGVSYSELSYSSALNDPGIDWKKDVCTSCPIPRKCIDNGGKFNLTATELCEVIEFLKKIIKERNRRESIKGEG